MIYFFIYLSKIFKILADAYWLLFRDCYFDKDVFSLKSLYYFYIKLIKTIPLKDCCHIVLKNSQSEKFYKIHRIKTWFVYLISTSRLLCSFSNYHSFVVTLKIVLCYSENLYPLYLPDDLYVSLWYTDDSAHINQIANILPVKFL